MTDQIDTANDIVQKGLNAVLAHHAKQPPSTTHCVACGDEINLERRTAIKTQRCLPCQVKYETLPYSRRL